MRGALDGAALYVALLVLLGAGGTTTPIPPAGSAAGPGPRTADAWRARGAVTDHVIVISIDGLRPDAIDHFGLKTLQRLMRGGSYTLEASTILPSRTLPSHTSMLTGQTPERHGILFNHEDEEHGVVGVPTMFEVARAHGFRTAAFYSKSKFRHLDRPESYDHRSAPSWKMDSWMVTRTVPEAVQYLHHRRPNLLFVHIGEPDYAGHTTGWMSFFYGVAARRADAGVSRILEEADETFGEGSYTVLVTADHGGHGHDHGSDHPLDTTIPWIVYGEGVKPGRIPAGIRTMDTAATALWLLGLSLPGEAEGRLVAAAFDRPPAILAGAAPSAAGPAQAASGGR